MGAHLVEELASQVGILVVQPAPERGHRVRAFFLHAAHLRTEVDGLDMHGHAARLNKVTERVRDLFSQTLLHGESPRVEPDEPGQLRDAEDLSICDVRDVTAPWNGKA